MQAPIPASGRVERRGKTVRLESLAVSYDGSGKAKGVPIYINGRSIPTAIGRDKVASDFAGPGEWRLAIKLGHRDKGQLGEFRIRPPPIS